MQLTYGNTVLRNVDVKPQRIETLVYWESLFQNRASNHTSQDLGVAPTFGGSTKALLSFLR